MNDKHCTALCYPMLSPLSGDFCRAKQVYFSLTSSCSLRVIAHLAEKERRNLSREQRIGDKHGCGDNQILFNALITVKLLQKFVSLHPLFLCSVSSCNNFHTREITQKGATFEEGRAKPIQKHLFQKGSPVKLTVFFGSPQVKECTRFRPAACIVWH